MRPSAVVIMKVNEAQAVRRWDLGTKKPDGSQQVVEAHRASGQPPEALPALDLKLEFVWYEVVFAFFEASYAGGTASRERVEGFETGEVVPRRSHETSASSIGSSVPPGRSSAGDGTAFLAPSIVLSARGWSTGMQFDAPLAVDYRHDRR